VAAEIYTAGDWWAILRLDFGDDPAWAGWYARQ
jgi:hypothetical protein